MWLQSINSQESSTKSCQTPKCTASTHRINIMGYNWLHEYNVHAVRSMFCVLSQSHAEYSHREKSVQAYCVCWVTKKENQVDKEHQKTYKKIKYLIVTTVQVPANTGTIMYYCRRCRSKGVKAHTAARQWSWHILSTERSSDKVHFKPLSRDPQALALGATDEIQTYFRYSNIRDGHAPWCKSARRLRWQLRAVIHLAALIAGAHQMQRSRTTGTFTSKSISLL